MSYTQIDNDQAKKLVLEFFEYSGNSSKREDFLQNVYKDGYKKYLMYKEDREQALRDANKEWRSNLFVPVAFTIIETWVPHIMSALFGSSPYMHMRPTSKDDFIKAQIAELLTSVQAEEDDIKIKFENMVKDCGIGGLAVGAEVWYTDEIEKKVVSRKRPGLNLFGRSFFQSPEKVESVEKKKVKLYGQEAKPSKSKNK